MNLSELRKPQCPKKNSPIEFKFKCFNKLRGKIYFLIRTRKFA